MDYGATGGYIVWAQSRGCAQTDASKGAQRCAHSRIPEAVGSNRFGLLLAFLALVRTSKAVLRHQRGARGANVIRPGIRGRATGSRRRDAFGGRPSTDENGR